MGNKTVLKGSASTGIAAGSKGVQLIESGDAKNSIGLNLPTVRQSNNAWYVTKDGQVFNATGYFYDGKTYFNAAVQRTNQALALGGELKAILWHQGCHDSRKLSDMDDYLSKLRSIVVEFRKQTGTTSVFIAGELPHWRTYSGAFNTMLKDIYIQVPYADYVSSEDDVPARR